MLNLIKYMDKLSGSWFENPWEYALRFPCNVALAVTAGVIVFSGVIFFAGGGNA